MGLRAYLRTTVGLCFCVVLALAGAASSAAAEAPTLQTRLGRALAVPQLARTQTAALAIDLRTGKQVYARNAALGLSPASTEKLTVAYAALALLGQDFRIETDVFADGERVGTTWRGSLVLKGFGDPTLSRSDLRALALGVRKSGVRHVTGSIVGDESYFDTRRVVAGWKSSFFIEESPPLSALVVDRGRSGGATSHNPALMTATLFRAELQRAGVRVAGRARVGRAFTADFPLAFVHSPKLSALVREMGLESDNFIAEMLLKQLGAYDGGSGSSAAGASVVLSVLRDQGIPVAGVRVVDGSGLSTLNRLTAASLVGLLRKAWVEPALHAAFVRSLPIAGVNGTLSRRLRSPPTRGRVLAKTGTTSNASTLAGFVGNRYAFAILHNGRPVPSWWARAAQDRFVTVLASSQ